MLSNIRKDYYEGSIKLMCYCRKFELMIVCTTGKKKKKKRETPLFISIQIIVQK